MTNKSPIINTKHGILKTPIFFPTVGWPGGRGEYDFLFKNLKYFCEKIDHYNFLFNFSSFIFGFNIPKKNFNTQYDNFIDKDLRDILTENTGIDKDLSKKLMILLDCGGNRIFNKIIFDDLPPTYLKSYEIYLNAYKKFIKDGNPDIFVNFDIGPSYTTKDEVSIKGSQIWNSISTQNKNLLNHELLKVSISFKNDTDLIMVPIPANDIDNLEKNLMYLFQNYKDEVNIIGIAGIAQSSKEKINESLKTFYEFKTKNNWDIYSHGLGLGGIENIPLLIKYDINSCDVASPWRRACTDKISEPYIPFLNADYEFFDTNKPFYHTALYNDIYSKLDCDCPFCRDISISEVSKRCFEADKSYNTSGKYENDFREMRIRIFFHNVFQHISLLKILQDYKNKYNNNFIVEFLKNMPNSKFKKNLQNPIYLK